VGRVLVAGRAALFMSASSDLFTPTASDTDPLTAPCQTTLSGRTVQYSGAVCRASEIRAK